MKVGRRGFLSCALGCVAVASASTVGATVTVPITLQELTERSDDVVVGEVRRASSQWDGGRIVTDYEIDIRAVMRGRTAVGTSLLARLPGGTVGRIGQTIAGVPSPEVGGTYVFFLQSGPSGLRYLTHLTASVMPVTLDTPTGTVSVTPHPSLTSLRAGAPLDAVSRAVLAVRR
jgi:hypothetical protein